MDQYRDVKEQPPLTVQLNCHHRLPLNSPAYVKGTTQYFPNARIVFDKFYAMVLAGQALDETRRELQRQEADLKGAMRSLRGR